jgi:hypothetical protein
VTRKAFVPFLVSIVALVSAIGCRPDRVQKTTSYFGPTETMAEVVSAINANNAGLPTLWSRIEFEAKTADDFVRTDGVLLYKSPRSMRLAGTREFVDGSVFEVGSTDDRYWMSISPPNQPSRLWWGWHRHIGKPCVDTRQLPIRPDLVLEVLGLSTFNTNFLEPPVPTMRFNPETRAYMFIWNTPMPNRWIAQKEIWYDMDSKLPTRVFLFDANGRVVLRARLSGHAPVNVPETPRDKGPKVARSFDLFFPDSGATMSLLLKADEVQLENKGIPTLRGIAFPKESRFDEIIQLDKDCTD